MEQQIAEAFLDLAYVETGYDLPAVLRIKPAEQRNTQNTHQRGPSI
jgi:hypothetical protein